MDQVFEIGLGWDFEPARAGIVGARILVEPTENLAVVRIFVVADASGGLVVSVFCHPSIWTELNGLVRVPAFYVENFALDDFYDTRIGIERGACSGGVLEFVTAKDVVVILFI